MNGDLLAEWEKRENRRRRNVRKHLKMQRKRRACLIAELARTPLTLPAIEAGCLSDEYANTILFGSIADARRATRLLQATLNASLHALVRTQRDGAVSEEIPLPTQRLQRNRRGAPSDPRALLRCYQAAIRATDTLIALKYLPGLAKGFAFFTQAPTLRLLPGIRIPKHEMRREFLLRLMLSGGHGGPALGFYSREARPLFIHPLPMEWMSIFSGKRTCT